jgi:hypothetical protein
VLVAEVGDEHVRSRIGIVHGDVDGLAGWQLGVEAMEPADNGLRVSLGCADPSDANYVTLTPRERVIKWARAAGVSGLLCTHTCLPYGQIIRDVDGDEGQVAVFNNGAAGMPNFSGERGTGLITRVSADPTPPADSMYGGMAGGLRYDAIPITYDHDAWMERFESLWPEGSDAHLSYHSRMTHGPASFTVHNAAREGVLMR